MSDLDQIICLTGLGAFLIIAPAYNRAVDWILDLFKEWK
ncbi:hypothetical protein HMPREF1484_02027 [Dermabacter sp. HFH0086]|nr:hypothetical protein HMPREF1484_02027 [Dermabacter sp. HFH0086]